MAQEIPRSRQWTNLAVNSNLTVTEYSARWLGLIASSVKPRTLEGYAEALRLHLHPLLGHSKVCQLQRGQIKSILASKLSEGLSRNSVRLLHATLRAMQ